MAVEKKCKYCSMMIPVDAKVCPHCRKKQGIGFIGKLFFVFFVLVILGAFLSTFENKPSKSLPQTIQETPLTEAGVKIKNENPSWSNEACNTIAKNEIFIGMHKDQVIRAWGKPHQINTTTGSYGHHEQWVMRDSINTDYLYFKNDILTTIQQSR